jgi:hypothetical protein
VLTETSTKYNDATSVAAATYITPQVTKVAGTESTYKVRIAANTLTANKAYKLTLVGKDLETQSIVTDTAYTVLTDAAGNTLKASRTLSFTTEGADVTGPKLVNIYKGSAIKAENVVTIVTNVKAGDVFTFEFDEELIINSSSNVKVQKFNGSTWTDETAATVATVNNAAGKTVGIKVTLNNSTTDAKYRIVVGKETVADKSSNVNKNV